MNAILSARGLLAERPALLAAPIAFEHLERRQFEFMHEALRGHGGLMCADTVVECLRTFCDQPLSRVARWIASRAIITVSWHGQTWVPMFQLRVCEASIRAGCSRVIAELMGVFSDWEIAHWFATPNAWLDGAAPVAMLDDDEPRVLEAARVDRFIANG